MWEIVAVHKINDEVEVLAVDTIDDVINQVRQLIGLGYEVVQVFLSSKTEPKPYECGRRLMDIDK